MASDETAGVDTSAAEAFERFLVPPIFGPWSRALVDLARPRPGERILDVACGTGVAARYAVDLVAPDGIVSAIDINPGMIAHARTLDPAGAIEWRQGSVMEMPYAAASFDVAVCNQGLQFFPDRAASLAEMRRVLVPGGRLSANVYCAPEDCPGHFAVIRALQARDVDAAAILRPYSFSDADQLRQAFADAGFRDIALERRIMESGFASAEAFVESLAAGGPAARLSLEQLDTAGLKALIEEVADALAGRTDGDRLTIETTSHMVLAYA